MVNLTIEELKEIIGKTKTKQARWTSSETFFAKAYKVSGRFEFNGNETIFAVDTVWCDCRFSTGDREFVEKFSVDEFNALESTP